MTRKLSYDYLNIVYEFECTVTSKNPGYTFYLSPLNAYSKSQIGSASHIHLLKDKSWNFEAFKNPRFGLRTVDELKSVFEDIIVSHL